MWWLWLDALLDRRLLRGSRLILGSKLRVSLRWLVDLLLLFHNSLRWLIVSIIYDSRLRESSDTSHILAHDLFLLRVLLLYDLLLKWSLFLVNSLRHDIYVRILVVSWLHWTHCLLLLLSFSRESKVILLPFFTRWGVSEICLLNSWVFDLTGRLFLMDNNELLLFVIRLSEF